MPVTPPPLPLTIIGGFLGAGKTTLLNRILSADGPRRLGIIVNDFGEINIDKRLISGRADGVISLSNGCICCDLSDGLYAALFRMTEPGRRPDHIVLETSGVADPGNVAQVGKIGRFFKLNTVVTMVDCSALPGQLGDKLISETVERQLASATLIVLNKSDLVSDDAMRSVETLVARHAPGVTTVRAVQADISPEFIFEASARSGFMAVGAATATVPSPHGMPFESISFSSNRTFERNKLQSVIANLPSGVLRGKGVVRFDDDPGRDYALQLVGTRWQLGPLDSNSADAGPSELVFIARAGDPDIKTLRGKLEACLAGHDRGPLKNEESNFRTEGTRLK